MSKHKNNHLSIHYPTQSIWLSDKKKKKEKEAFPAEVELFSFLCIP